MDTTGRSIAGNSRIGMLPTDIPPIITSIREITAAKTGRRTETSEISMNSSAVGRRAAHSNVGLEALHLCSVTNLVGTLGHDTLPVRQALRHHHVTGNPAAQLHLALFRDARTDHEYILPGTLGYDCLFRGHQ